jgi:cytochrome d ubiquinol oxidase subunit I
LAIPAGFIATECGWIVREVGRQPWIVYGMIRTSEGVSPIGAGAAAASLAAFSAVYLALFVLFIFFTVRIVKRGPDMSSPLPAGKSVSGAGTAGGAGPGSGAAP